MKYLFAFGLFLLITSFGCYIIITTVVKNKINKTMHLARDKNGSYNEMLTNYLHPPYDVKIQFWIFSVQNPHNFTKNKNSKIHFFEKGPYTFIEKQQKNLINFSNEDNRLLYINKRHYIFNSTLSCSNCNLNDTVTIPNIFYHLIVGCCLNPKYCLNLNVDSNLKCPQTLMDYLFKIIHEGIFVKITVNELLFEGYEDTVLSMLCKKNGDLCQKLGIPKRIGLFYQVNGTNDGVYEVGTGLNNLDELGKVFSWNYMNSSLSNKYWNGNNARMINGTDGQLFVPYSLYSKPKFYVFIGNVCRSVELEFKEEITVKKVPVYRYIPAKSMLDIDLQESLGFCSPNTPKFFENTYLQKKNCLPSGILDVKSCNSKALNVFLSSSHFYNSPKEIYKFYDGISDPSQLNDESSLDIEPTTGIVVSAQQRSQINIGFYMLKNSNLPKIMPLVWLNESVMFDDKTKEKLLQVSLLLYYSKSFGMLFGFLGLCLSVFVAVTYYSKRKNENLDDTNVYEPIISQDYADNENTNEEVVINASTERNL